MEQDDSIFGCDYSSNGGVTSTGDIETVEGLDNAKQNIKNWLLTKKGFYPSIENEYGSDINTIFGEDFSEASLRALRIIIQNALFDNPRVKEIKRIEPYVTIDKKLKVVLHILLVNGTEESLNLTVAEEV